MTSKDTRTTTGSDNVVIGNNSDLPVPFDLLDIDRATPRLHPVPPSCARKAVLNWKAGVRAPKDKEASATVPPICGSDFPLAK